MKKEVQKTSLLGVGGLAVFVATAKSMFMDVPVEEIVAHLNVLTVNQLLELVVPLVLGTVGIFYDEEKKSK